VGREPRAKEITDALGITLEASRGWRHGVTVSENTLEKMRTALLGLWPFMSGEGGGQKFALPSGDLENIDRVIDDILDENVDVKEYADMLGFSEVERAQVLDLNFFNDAPLLSGMYYGAEASEGDADRDFQEFSGVYEVLMERRSPSGELTHLRGPLEIRHPLRVSAKRVLIRTRMSLARDPGQRRSHAIYDGWMRVHRRNTTPHIIWVFTKRLDPFIDHGFMITELPQERGAQMSLTGRYLTIGDAGAPDSGTVRINRTGNLGDTLATPAPRYDRIEPDPGL
jgi:hypothetical protein